jgi:hypothetical protein
MGKDDAALASALGGDVEIAAAAVALGRLRSAERAGPAIAAPARGLPSREAALGPPRRRRPLLRRATVITSAVVLMGGATAAAATNLVPIFEPESVTPVVIQTGDIASLQALSRFGTVTGTSKLDLTPESSANALASAAGFSLPTVAPPAGLAALSPSYWLVIRSEGGASRGQRRRRDPARTPRCGRFGPAGRHRRGRPRGVGFHTPRGYW